MNLKKVTLLFILLTCLAYTTLAQTDYTLKSTDVTIKNGVITACGCTFGNKRIIIPEKIGDITITEIGDYAFSGKSLVAVAFAKKSQVVSIGLNAFWRNTIATLTLPTTLTTIGIRAFYNNKITELTFPDDLTTIGSNAFQNNLIRTLTFPNDLTTIGASAFQSQKNNSLTSVTFAGDQNNKSMIQSIGINAFSGNTGLMSITLPPNGNPNFLRYVDTQGKEYAEGATITDFTLGYNAFIPYELTAEDIDVNGFGIIVKCYCDKFTSRDISIPASITQDGNPVNIFGIRQNIFNDKQLTSVVLPEGLISIGRWAFAGNSLATLTLPSSVKYIGSQAFYGSNLTAVTFAGDEANIISIGHEAFGYNTVTSINLPSHVQGNAGFKYKDSDGNEYAEGAEFKDFDHSLYADIPYTLTADDIEVDADGVITKCNCDNFDSRTITIPTAITTPNGQLTITGIGNNVFGDKTLATVSFEAGSQITAIRYNAFNYNSIATLSLPTTLTTIGDYAFYDNKITELTLPTTLTTIGGSAFANNKITKLTFPDHSQLTTIGEYAFYASIITTLNLPTALTTIGKSAFGNNPSLESFTLPMATKEGFRTYWQDGDSADLGANLTILKADFGKSFELVSIEQVTLTTAVAEQQGGTISATPNHSLEDNQYDINTKVELTATPNDGWRFDKWVISDEENKNDKVAITLDQDKTATAHFVQLVTLTTSVAGQQGGTISTTPKPSLEDNQYDINTKVTLTATPNDGWRFDKWVISDEENKTDKTTTITLDQDKTATAHFVQLVTLTTSVAGQQGGTISTTPKPSLEDNQYDIDTEVTLTAKPDEGWKFDKWVIGTDESTDNPTDGISMDTDKTATAHFVKEEEAITSILTEVVSANPYPNPVTSQITLKAKDGDLIQLFSPKGKQQYSTQHTGNEVHTIDVSTMPVGVYLVRITDAEGNTTTKRILKK